MAKHPRIRLFLLALLLGLAGGAHVRSEDQTAAPEGELHLLPAPQEIVVTRPGEGFALSGNVSVALADEATEEDEFTVSDLREQIKKLARISLQLDFGIPSGRAILLGIPQRDAEYAEGLKDLAALIDAGMGDEGYVLDVTPDRIVILANKSAGLFYGVQTLCQLVDPTSRKVPCVRIRDWPDLPQRWVMYDVGRFQRINISYCERIIRNLARAKINGLMLYMEDDYRFQAYPFLGREGTFTRTKAARLVSFARKYHVQLIPHFQSLAHMYGVLRHDELADIREREDAGQVCPLAPRTVEFFGTVYGELCAAFDNTRFFHVGGDEFEHGFAQCPRCQAEVERIGRSGLYARHMNALHSLLKKRGRTMLYWPSHKEGGAHADYYDPARTVSRSLTLQAKEDMPKDAVITEWAYFPAEDYPTVGFYQEAGLRNILVASEVKGTLALYPNMRACFDNAKRLFGFARDRKLMGACICTWSLYRGALFETSWPGLLYAAQCGWCNAKANPRDFAREFAVRWLGIRDDVLDDMAMVLYFPYVGPRETRYWRIRGTAPEIFFRHPRELRRYLRMFVTGDVQRQSQELLAVTDEALAAVDRLKAKAKRNMMTLDFIESSIMNYRHVARKCLYLEEAARAYRQAAMVQGRDGLPHLHRAIAALEDLNSDVPYLARMFNRAADECGGRKEDVIREAEQDDWAKRTNRIRGITPVMDLQQAMADLLSTLQASKSKARANQLLPAPAELGFEELTDIKVGMWSGADVCPSGPDDHRMVIWEVTKYIDGPGPYEAVYDCYAGPDDLRLVSTMLYVSNVKGAIGLDEMTRVAEDIHDGVAGELSKDNIYMLQLDRHDTRLRHFVVGEVYDERNRGSRGVVWFRKKERPKEPEMPGAKQEKED